MGAAVVIAKKTDPGYRAGQDPPCPSVAVNGRIIARDAVVDYERLKAELQSRTFTVFMSTAPYSSENTATSVHLAAAALEKGHRVNLVASGDGVYCFLKRQKAKGITNAEEAFAGLIGKGLRVFL